MKKKYKKFLNCALAKKTLDSSVYFCDTQNDKITLLPAPLKFGAIKIMSKKIIKRSFKSSFFDNNSLKYPVVLCSLDLNTGFATSFIQKLTAVEKKTIFLFKFKFIVFKSPFLLDNSTVLSSIDSLFNFNRLLGVTTVIVRLLSLSKAVNISSTKLLI